MSSPYINHFLQPDSIIPNPSNPQSWNRYSYVLDNPINASDPTGHKCAGKPEECLNEKGKPINGAGGFGGSSSNSGGGGGGGNDDNSPNEPNAELELDGGAAGQCKINEPYSCPLAETLECKIGEPYSCPTAAALPTTLTYHLFDSNVVSRIPIYDNQYFTKA